MWRRLVPCLVLLPLAACVAEPYSAYPAGYGQPGYGQPTYGYPSAGYGYSDGYPSMVYGGETVFLIPGGSGWGWHDRDHRWHDAPPHISERLRHDHPQGLPPRGERPNWGGGNRPPERRDVQPQPQFHQQQQAAPQPQFRPQPAAQPAQPQHQERRRDCDPSKQHC